MKRATPEDINHINSIVNASDIRPMMGPGNSELDVSHTMEGQFLFVDEFGVILADPMGHGEYLGLSAFLKPGRGLHAVVAHRRVMEAMFLWHDARKICATIDPSNVSSVRLLPAIGFPKIYRSGNRIVGEIDFWEWVLQSKKCYGFGKYILTSLGLDLSPEETAGVGALHLCEMGQVSKCLYFYNRSSRLSHLGRIRVLNDAFTEFGIGCKRFEKTHNGLVGMVGEICQPVVL